MKLYVPEIFFDKFEEHDHLAPRSSKSINCGFIAPDCYCVKEDFRVQLEKIYENMGGPNLDPSANTVLNNLQKKLNAVLDKLSGQFVESLAPNIHEQMNKLGVILSKIKGPQLQKSQLAGVSICLLVKKLTGK